MHSRKRRFTSRRGNHHVILMAREPGHSLDRARAHYRAALEIHPKDAELWGLLGRVDKDAWTTAWQAASPADKRSEGAYEAALLRSAIDSYTSGFRTDPSHYYSGINALTLMSLLMDLQAHLGTLPIDVAIGRRRGRSAAPEAAVARKPRRRRMSPETRAKLAASAKKRWAEAKKAGKKRLG